MTDNISRMYELAGVKKIGKKYSCGLLEFDVCRTQNCDICDKAQDKNYPPFTEFKQLELIKWLASEHNDIEISWYSDIGFRVNNFLDSCEHKDFPQALAGLVCELWEDLSDKQREEVKGILQ